MQFWETPIGKVYLRLITDWKFRNAIYTALDDAKDDLKKFIGTSSSILEKLDLFLSEKEHILLFKSLREFDLRTMMVSDLDAEFLARFNLYLMKRVREFKEDFDW
jgi:hypothetical protein